MIYNTRARKIFNVFNIFFLVLFSLMIILPFINLLAISLSSYFPVVSGEIVFIPKGFNFRSYEKILTNPGFRTSFFNTVWLTIVNTSATILVALCAGFALSSKHLKSAKKLMIFFLVPMYFSGGMIPTYMVVTKMLRLSDSFLALILPLITSSFYIIIFRNNIMNLPQELMESADIDGANEYVTLFRVVAPVILPTIAAFIIINAVSNWNQWYNVMLYIKSNTKWTLQYFLRDLMQSKGGLEFLNEVDGTINYATAVHPTSFKMAALYVTVLPILAIYPFCQKYFIYGIITGAVKG